MPKRTANYTDIEESGYQIDDRMRSYMEEKYPDLDPYPTFELFRDNCLANDRIYASWPAAFRNYLRKPADWGGFVYKAGMEGDPAWRQLIIEADAIGFRRPRTPIETAAQYRKALREHTPPTDLIGGVIDVNKILKPVLNKEKNR